jgi:hypothetical protein
MSTVLRSPCHRNAAIVLFDAGRLNVDHALREIRARFGAGLVRSVPYHGTCPFTQGEAQEAAAMFGPCQLEHQIKEDLIRCRHLGQRQAALMATLRRESWMRRVEEIYSGVDETIG